MAVSSYYAWRAERARLAVFLSSELIQQLNDAITSDRRADPGRNGEMGGILLGRIEYRREQHPVVHIDEFEPIESEHRRGPSFLLTDRDKKRLGKRLASWNRKRGDLQPVGYYRTHTRRGLYLDNDDFSVIRAYFPDPHSVFMLVRPVPGASSVGGFFFWDEGDIHRESSYLEFPFDAAKLPLVSPPPEPVLPPQPSIRLGVRRPSDGPRLATNGHGPQPASSQPASLQTTPGRSWLRMTIPAAGVLLFGFSFYTVRTLTAPRQTAPAPITVTVAPPAPPPVDKSAPSPSAGPPAPVVPLGEPAIQRPSPFKSRPVLQARAPLAPVTSTPPSQKESTADPTGTAARSAADPEPVATIPVAPPPAPPAPASAPPEMASLSTPARVERPVKPPAGPVATVTVEPVAVSKLGRFVGKIPGLRRLEKKNQGFVPARPIREIAPAVPADEGLDRTVPVDLRVTVDPAGNVAAIEPTRGGDKRLVRLATDAARDWRFEPARRNDETVSSELILHFTFKPPATRAEP